MNECAGLDAHNDDILIRQQETHSHKQPKRAVFNIMRGAMSKCVCVRMSKYADSTNKIDRCSVNVTC